MRRVATLALALLVLGCVTPKGDPVPLLTAPSACYAGGEGPVHGLLVADAEYGTRFNGMPVIWPLGYTAVRVGSEVVVLNKAGNVAAMTGRRYGIAPAAPEDQTRRLMNSYGAFPAAVECPYPQDFNQDLF